MAHFAKLDENNVVLTVIVINNDVIQNLPFPDSEPIGVAFCQSLYGADTIWKQTSYNANFRKNYAETGGVYDPSKDVFIGMQPYPSWVLNPETLKWEAPIPYPRDTYFYIWDEPTTSWVLVPYPSDWVFNETIRKWGPPP